MAPVFHPVQSDQALAVQTRVRGPRPPPVRALGRHLRPLHHRLRLGAQTRHQDCRSCLRRI